MSHAWQNLATDKFDADFIERRRAALEVIKALLGLNHTSIPDLFRISSVFHYASESTVKIEILQYQLNWLVNRILIHLIM